MTGMLMMIGSDLFSLLLVEGKSLARLHAYT